MKILYLNIAGGMSETPDFLEDVHYVVISVTDFRNALRLVEMESFDALVIEEGSMHPGTLNFIADVRRARPELPICVASDWGADLATVLQSLEVIASPEAVY
jgi:DNA-binding response OmpR family regulator